MVSIEMGSAASSEWLINRSIEAELQNVGYAYVELDYSL